MLVRRPSRLYVKAELAAEDVIGIKVGGSIGYMALLPGGREEIIDRFFLGGDNLRGLVELINSDRPGRNTYRDADTPPLFQA